ncbi:hypothetical protein JOE68_005565 [Saccharothrix algeriensis]|uniref:Uncharacterized protein n=1 Tax=Saccharothrix algeriensis TaxID=173560 RepID=A0ABS2SEJ6_9PSEU|nr:hypothetical protein [Saccharothrix algeriensis]
MSAIVESPWVARKVASDKQLPGMLSTAGIDAAQGRRVDVP